MTAIERSPLGAARERPVPCQFCMASTFNWSARCDEHLAAAGAEVTVYRVVVTAELHACSKCGRPTIEEPCSSCSNADEETGQ